MNIINQNFHGTLCKSLLNPNLPNLMEGFSRFLWLGMLYNEILIQLNNVHNYLITTCFYRKINPT